MRYKIKHLFLFVFVFLHCSSNNKRLVIGAERTDIYFPLIYDKSIGIIGNQSSLIGSTHLVDSLLSAKFQILKVFSPEHGFRGIADAGAYIKNEIDESTGLPIISLYGKNKKPTQSQLDGLEILLFDIQDVGARFYTYISTLHYVMEAAAENNIPLIVLDRPNPNGHYFDGPVLDTAFSSFVGMHPVPIVHGMTIGEYAQMINGEKWLKNNLECDLTIVSMIGYNKHISYNLPVKPSPNLPNSQAINLYPSLCLFEGTNVSVGRGTVLPFQQYGAPYLDNDHSFVPESRLGAKNPKYSGKRCFGKDLSNSDKLSKIDLSFLIDAYKECPNKDDFFNSFFDKLAGNDVLRLSIIEGKNENIIRQGWNRDLRLYEEKRNKYLLY